MYMPLKYINIYSTLLPKSFYRVELTHPLNHKMWWSSVYDYEVVCILVYTVLV